MRKRELFYNTFIFTALFAILISADISFAQLSVGFSTNQVYDSNPYRSPIAEGEIISGYNGGVEYDFKSINILYYGSFSLFNKSSERNYYWHQLGLYKTDGNYTYGFYGEQRINKTDFNIYDYTSINGYYRRQIEGSFLNPILNFTTSYRSYTNLSDYSNIFISAGANFNKSFETKTAFIINTSLNYKYYLNTGDLLGGQKVSSALSSTQIYSNFRVAQSLWENTGLAVYYLNRSLIGGSLSPASDYYSSYGDESDLYDDPYSRGENSFGIELTQIFPAEIITKAGYELSYRNYPSQGIYTSAEIYETGNNRDDTQNTFYLQMNKTVALDSAGSKSLNLGINYTYTNRESNSYWYQYKGSQFSINLGLQF